MTRALVAATVAAILAGVGLGASPASAAVPDPLAPGPLSVRKVEYSAGTLMLTTRTPAGRTFTFPQPLEGSVIYPAGSSPAKVALFLHGRHDTCLGPDGQVIDPDTSDVTCPDRRAPDGGSEQTRIRSYQGYDYLAANLASRGYAVISPSANVVADFDAQAEDGGALARAQTIAATLDLLYLWNNGTGPVTPGDDLHTVGTKLNGRLELERIGLMGHSRGGDAVALFPQFNAARPRPLRRYPLSAVLALAPVDFGGSQPDRVNFATLLPNCDGDVSNLQGARIYERVKYARRATPFAKIQWAVEGANHNYYNTVWTDDDAFGFSSFERNLACGARFTRSIRLEPSDQRRTGLALINSFLRRYLGGETAFEPLMTGATRYPRQACPVFKAVPCSQLAKTSYIGPVALRTDVIRLPDTAAGATTRNATGGTLRTTGALGIRWCNDLAGPLRDRCPPQSAPERPNRSAGPQLVASWRGPGRLRAELRGEGRNVARHRALMLRVANNFFDERNPQSPDGIHVARQTQDFDVVLTDRAGRSARTNAARWSDALEPSIGSLHVTLNGVRIPLTAFRGVDLSNLATLDLEFGRVRRQGLIQLADVSFQERRGPPPVFRAARPPDGPRTPGGPLADAVALDGATGSPASRCDDGRAPRMTIAGTPRLAGGRLRVRGTLADAGCGGARAQVAVVVPATRDRCRFLRADGLLSRPRSCSLATELIARPRSGAWAIDAPARLPAGVEVRLLVRGLDAAGRLAPTRRIALRTG